MVTLGFAGVRLSWSRDRVDCVERKKVVRWTIWRKVVYIPFDSWA